MRNEFGLALLLLTIGCSAVSVGQSSGVATRIPAIAPGVSSPSASQAPQPTVGATPTIQPRSAATDTSSSIQDRQFDGKRAYQYLLKQMEFGPRPVGSTALKLTGDYLLSELDRYNWVTDTDTFQFRNVAVRNLLASRGQGPLLIVGAHYDARARSDRDPQHSNEVVPAANDGASGAAVLLELARVLDLSRLKNRVMLAFFDAEDDGDLDMCQSSDASCDHTPWPWSVGAEHVASLLNETPTAVIILDMVGDLNQDFYYEVNSDHGLRQDLWAVAGRLGFQNEFFAREKYSMEDDHTPFLRRGYRAVDIIDFDYPYWHTTQDTADKVAPESLERIGRVLQTWLEQK